METLVGPGVHCSDFMLLGSDNIGRKHLSRDVIFSSQNLTPKNENISLRTRSTDHDKGQKSAIARRRLNWGFSPFSTLLCNLVRNGPKMWRKLPEFRAEKFLGAESCHVWGCHGFSVPNHIG